MIPPKNNTNNNAVMVTMRDYGHFLHGAFEQIVECVASNNEILMFAIP